MSWLKHEHPHYRKNVHKWKFAHDHLTGAVLDELHTSNHRIDTMVFRAADPGADKGIFEASHYLYKRLQGESDEAYTERLNIADYTPYFPNGVITLAGMLWEQDRNKKVTWEESEFGDPKEVGSIAYQLANNADGRGGNWSTVMQGGTTEVITTKEVWVLVEGVQRAADGTPINRGSVRFIVPQNVPDWGVDDSGNLEWVKVKDVAVFRESMRDEPKEEEICIIYTKEGWQRFKEGEKDVEAIDEQVVPYGGESNPTFRYYTTNDPSTWSERLPIFRCELPIRANIGYLMARKANAIYNLENARDFQLWAACFPRIMLDVLFEDGSLNTELFNEIKQAFLRGDNALPGKGHEFKTPPVDGAEIRNETIEQKVKAFLKTFFQAAGDQARERTATEIMHSMKAGVEAFLVQLAITMQEIENEALFLLEQVNFPDQPDKWGHTRVTYSTNFSSIDVDAEIDRAISRWIPGGVLPAHAELQEQIVRRAAERDRLKIDDDVALKAQIRQAQDQQTQANDVFSQIRRRRTGAGVVQ